MYNHATQLMSELLAAVDDTNNGEYLGFVVGDRESVDINIKKLPTNFIHTTFMPSKSEKKSAFKQI